MLTKWRVLSRLHHVEGTVAEIGDDGALSRLALFTVVTV
jgi:hypothetical protein